MNDPGIILGKFQHFVYGVTPWLNTAVKRAKKHYSLTKRELGYTLMPPYMSGVQETQTKFRGLELLLGLFSMLSRLIVTFWHGPVKTKGY